MSTKIRLTESELHNMIRQCVNEAINQEIADGELEEGWLGDKWNQTKSAVKTFTNSDRDNNTLSNRWNQAKKNWNTQGELNDLQNLKDQLSKYLEAGQIDPQTTIAQLVGGKFNNNKFGKLTGQIANRRAQISNRGGKSY